MDRARRNVRPPFVRTTSAPAQSTTLQAPRGYATDPPQGCVGGRHAARQGRRSDSKTRSRGPERPRIWPREREVSRSHRLTREVDAGDRLEEAGVGGPAEVTAGATASVQQPETGTEPIAEQRALDFAGASVPPRALVDGADPVVVVRRHARSKHRSWHRADSILVPARKRLVVRLVLRKPGAVARGRRRQSVPRFWRGLPKEPVVIRGARTSMV